VKRVRADFATNNHRVYSRKETASSFYLLEFEQNVSHTASLYSQHIQSGEETKKGYHLSNLNSINMINPLKQVAGIDVAKNELVVSLGRMNPDTTIEVFAN
jgi:hypothetical protein